MYSQLKFKFFHTCHETKPYSFIICCLICNGILHHQRRQLLLVVISVKHLLLVPDVFGVLADNLLDA